MCKTCLPHVGTVMPLRHWCESTDPFIEGETEVCRCPGPHYH